MSQPKWLLIGSLATALAAAAPAQYIRPVGPAPGAYTESYSDHSGYSDWQGAALGLKVGTLGPGAEATVNILPWLNARAGGNYIKFTYSRNISDIDWDLTVDYSSFPLMLDLHPFGVGFRISGGVVIDNNEIKLDATPTESKTIGDHEYTPEQMGTLSGRAKFDPLALYAGIGYGNAVGEDSSWSFIFDLGVMFQRYDLDLSANGTAAQNPQFQRDLQEEEDNLKGDLDRFQFYPVLAFGVAYHF